MALYKCVLIDWYKVTKLQHRWRRHSEAWAGLNSRDAENDSRRASSGWGMGGFSPSPDGQGVWWTILSSLGELSEARGGALAANEFGPLRKLYRWPPSLAYRFRILARHRPPLSPVHTFHTITITPQSNANPKICDPAVATITIAIHFIADRFVRRIMLTAFLIIKYRTGLSLQLSELIGSD